MLKVKKQLGAITKYGKNVRDSIAYPFCVSCMCIGHSEVGPVLIKDLIIHIITVRIHYICKVSSTAAH